MALAFGPTKLAFDVVKESAVWVYHAVGQVAREKRMEDLGNVRLAGIEGAYLGHDLLMFVRC